MHESTIRQKMWDQHSLTGWYLGTSLEHYRSHIFFCKKTKSDHISDTFYIKFHYITQLMPMPADILITAVEGLKSAVRQASNDPVKNELTALQELNKLLTPEVDSNNTQKKVTCEQCL